MTIAPTSLRTTPARPETADAAPRALPEPSTATLTSARPIETEYRPRRPVDVRRTVLYQRHGGGDPTMVVAGEVIWRASRTPEGVATLAIREISARCHPRSSLGSRSRMGARTAACALRRARRAGRLRPDTPSPHRRRAPPQPRRADRPHRRVLRLAGQRDHRAEGDRHAGVRRLAPPGHLARRARPRADSATDVRPARASTAGGWCRPGRGTAPDSSRRRRARSSRPHAAATPSDACS